MIEANQLRVGNWYLVGLSGHEQPQQFNNWSEALDFEGYGTPIPLTEEIMINMGFSSKYKSCGYSFYKDGVYFTNQDEDGEGNPIDNFVFYVSLDYKYDRIYFVHQLQNRFYSLTGKELTVNL